MFLNSFKLSIHVIAGLLVIMALYLSSALLNESVKGYLNTVIIVFNYLIYYNFLKKDYSKYLDLERDLNYILIFILSILIIQKIFIERPSFLLYEPSYLAIFLLPIIHMKFISGWSTISAALFGCIILITQSLLLVILLLIYTLVLYSRMDLRIIYMSFSITIMLYCFSFIPRIDRVYDRLFAFSESLSMEVFATLVITISGNRLFRAYESYSVFLDNPFWGVGAGKVGEVFMKEHVSLSKVYAGLIASDYNEGSVPVNMLLQLLAESGVLGGGLIIVSVCSVLLNLLKFGRPGIAALLSILGIVFIESNMFRPYLFAGIGMIIGMSTYAQQK